MSHVNKIVELFFNNNPTGYIEHTMETHLSVHVSSTLKEQMAKGREKGYHSWWHYQRCTPEDLAQSLKNAVERGDYSTSMIFAAMLDFRNKHGLEAPPKAPESLQGVNLIFKRLWHKLHNQIPEQLEDVFMSYILTEKSVMDENMVMSNGQTFLEMITTKVMQGGIIHRPYHIVFTEGVFTPTTLRNADNWLVLFSDDVYASETETYVYDTYGLKQRITSDVAFYFQTNERGRNVLQGVYNGPEFLLDLIYKARADGLHLVFTLDTMSYDHLCDPDNWLLAAGANFPDKRINHVLFKGEEPCQATFF